MKRRLLYFVTSMSALLCAAAAAMWLRGYYVVDWPAMQVWRHYPGETVQHEWRLMSGRGVVAVIWQRDASPPVGTGEDTRPRFSYSSGDPMQFAVMSDTWWQRLGFNAVDRTHRDARFPTWSRRNRSVRVPYWLLVAVTAPLPVIGVILRWRGRRRFGAGLCPRCGYDLRATPDKCPECGSAG